MHLQSACGNCTDIQHSRCAARLPDYRGKWWHIEFQRTRMLTRALQKIQRTLQHCGQHTFTTGNLRLKKMKVHNIKDRVTWLPSNRYPYAALERACSYAATEIRLSGLSCPVNATSSHSVRLPCAPSDQMDVLHQIPHSNEESFK